jgi:hypothetical protein
MNRLFILVFAILSILTFSCKKSSNETTSSTTVDYYKLKVGNYWIYQSFKLDSNGVATPQNNFDSAYIEKDTMIRGNNYYKLWENHYVLGNTQFPSYIRDSSGYLVNSSGYRLCSDNDFTDTLGVDTIQAALFRGYIKMTGKDSVVTVPAGSFPSITVRMKVVLTNPATPHPIRYIYDVYGKNIGRIKTHNFYFNTYQQFEGRLVRYKVQ